MVELDPEQRAMLNEALNKTRRLVGELEKQKQEIDGSPPPKGVDPEQFALGRHAMIKAIASARRSLAALEDAERIANAPADEEGGEGTAGQQA
jgi:hypothetical protein